MASSQYSCTIYNNYEASTVGLNQYYDGQLRRKQNKANDQNAINSNNNDDCSVLDATEFLIGTVAASSFSSTINEPSNRKGILLDGTKYQSERASFNGGGAGFDPFSPATAIRKPPLLQQVKENPHFDPLDRFLSKSSDNVIEQKHQSTKIQKGSSVTDDIFAAQEREFDYYRKPFGESNRDERRNSASSISKDVYDSQKRAMNHYQSKKAPIQTHTRRNSFGGVPDSVNNSLSPPSNTRIASHYYYHYQNMNNRYATMDNAQFTANATLTGSMKQEVKERRKLTTAVGLVGGGVAGGLIFGPAGAVIGSTAGGVITNRVTRMGERQAQRKWEKAVVQNSADISKQFNPGYFT